MFFVVFFPFSIKRIMRLVYFDENKKSESKNYFLGFDENFKSRARYDFAKTFLRHFREKSINF